MRIKHFFLVGLDSLNQYLLLVLVFIIGFIGNRQYFYEALNFKSTVTLHFFVICDMFN